MKIESRRFLFRTTAMIGLAIMPLQAHADPQGGSVSAGSAAISSSGNTTTIHQSSDRAIIRWDSFDVGAGERVQFQQPGRGSITVNRIQDHKPSQIDGHIGANGNIVLINPNGMVFGAASTVDVGGLVATTSDLEDDNAFMAGGALKFTRPGNPDARVVNNGAMTVRDGGLVGLVAPHVENHGVIEARLGKVALASGDISTIDFAGDGLIKLEVSDAVLSQSVTNTGTIRADGGSILLTAAQARGMVEALVTNTGTLQARTITVGGAEHKGQVVVSTKGLPKVEAAAVQAPLPRAASVVVNTGTIDVSGESRGESGGDITITADKIVVGDGSYITAAADTNGGSIKIGGDYQGGGTIPTSDTVFISEHAILTASSRRNGKGGRVILWSDTNTRFYGDISSEGGIEAGDGGFIEISSKGTLGFAGTVSLKSCGGADGTLLLDPTDIVISAAADSNVSGGGPFTPTVDNGPSVLNITTLLNALASGNVIVQTRSTGVQTGNITVDSAITWSSGNTLTLDAHNNIIVNQAISGANVTLVVGNDLQLNADISGTGTLTIQQASDATTVGIGASAVGTLNLNTTDLSHIIDGWNNIVIGKATGSVLMDVRTVTFTDNLTLKSGAGVITFNGTLNTGANNLTVTTDADILLLGALTGTGTLTIQQASAATTMGIGGSVTGTVNLTSTETARITNGWADLVFGRTDGSGAVIFGTATWNDNVTMQSGAGIITVSGVQTLGTNNLTVITDANIVVGANLGGSGVLTIQQASASTTIGIGASQTGTINLDATEFSRLVNGWSLINIGRTDATGDSNFGTLSWNDFLNIRSGTGIININGNQTMAANTLTITTDADIVLTGTLGGSSTLTIQQASASTTMGIGSSETGTISFTDTEVGRFTNGWTNLVFGRADGTGAVNVGTTTWNDNLTLQTGTGVITVSGTVLMNSTNNLTVRTDADFALNGALTSGTGGTLTILQSSAGTTMGIGDLVTGSLLIDAAEEGRITNGWASLVFGRTDGTATMRLGAAGWSDNVTFRNGSGVISVEGTQNASGNNMLFITNADIQIGASLTGSGNLFFYSTLAAASMGVGSGQSGDVSMTDTELNFITNGWTGIFFGSTSQTGALNIGAKTWNDSITFRTLTGQISINGAQNLGANSLTIISDQDVAINASLAGTVSIFFLGTSVGTSIGIGDGQAGTLQFSNTDLAYITDGWKNIYFGAATQTGAMNIGTTTWNDAITFRTLTGLLSVNGTVNGLANTVTFQTANLTVGANLTGTGTLVFVGAAVSTSMGVGSGQAGTLSIDDTELGYIQNTWATLIFGGTSQTAAMNIKGRTWTRSVDFRTSTGVMTFSGATDVGANNLTIRAGYDLTLSQNLAGTGNITITTASTSSSMGINVAAGTLQLTTAELAYIANGWTNIIFGSTSQTGAMNVGAATWNDSVDFRTNTGVITISGTQNAGANNLTIRSNANPVISAALTGTGNLNLITSAIATSIGIGTGQAGTFHFDDTELNYITNGWGSIIIGNPTSGSSYGAVNIGARTWSDNLQIQSYGGVITIAGAQTMGANDLLIKTSANLALNANVSGTGTLTIQAQAASTTIGIGTGQTGTLSLNDTELARIVNGWNEIIIGTTDSTVAMNVGAATWNDNLTLQTGSGLLTIAGVQTMGANNLTMTTNSSLAINANLSGSGTLTIKRSTASTTIGVGDGQVGTLALSNAELARILDGWSSVIVGSTAGIGTINIGAYTWVNPMTFLTQGDVVVNGVQQTTETVGTSLVYATTNGRFINNAGAAGINPGTSRYLVYSVDENNDTLNGIARGTVLSNKTFSGYGPASVVEAGNVFLYSGVVAKILYLTVDDTTKIYGDTLPNFSYTYDGGLVNGDVLGSIISGVTYSVVGASVFDNAGTVRVITGNFTLNNGYTALVTAGYLTVTKADLVAASDAASREYGLSNPVLTATYTGFKNGDDETDIDTLASVTTGATIFSNAGTYAITASGAADNNYNFIYASNDLQITKATLTATMQNASRAYGDSNPAFTAVYTGFRNAETSAVIDTLASGVTAATGTSNVGTYSIGGTGALDNNYTFNYVNGTLTVNKAVLTATADNKSRVYGDSNPALTVTYTGFKNGETQAVIDTLAAAATAATTASNVGTYSITASGAVDNNYSFSYAGGTLTVNKATLTATAGSVSRQYGDTNPTIGVTYTGFKNGETQAVIDTLAAAATAATTASNVGTYSITASGAVDNNYSFSYAGGTLTVNKATLTATAGSVSRQYGDTNPTIGVTYTGFKNGETQTVIDTLATGGSAATAASNVGSYTTTASGASDGNYDFVYTDGVLTINKATLTATAGSASRDYGDSNPALTVTYTGFKNGETSAVIDTLATGGSAATAASNVGSYTTTASGAIDNNYDFVYHDGTMTVTKATLNVRANDAARDYGQPDPAFTVSYTGFRNGDSLVDLDVSAVASSTANSTSPVGSTYPIVASGASDDNYQFNYINGTLTILDPAYVPPPPSPPAILPPTVEKTLVEPVSYAIPVSITNAASVSSMQNEASYYFLPEGVDYGQAWVQSPYLIAFTAPLIEYYDLHGQRQ